ncbi:pseudouridine synthase [Geoalkalibacter halelectricus]|uniref:Pseudouridine synthase n=1 Tax=Geoalkalibacter halelectricus TaxID=2847045 RepID=A0ABY5ZIP2_9BACT|nr:pseudouridine synthase [Geoalkalibacter halelectricus]MDO3376581.1 rRNA pseudouridine synthase [Geoalkalibacter halelectricus]UWZ78458.1 rRNA pseudouridine synthase [Geoalkalibacter halelectricus]
MKERLQKLIAAAGLGSRRQAEEWIAAGRVRLNGRTACLGDKADPRADRIQVDGRELPRSEDKVYLLLHKPAGYVTTLRDPQGRPIVTDLIKNCPARVFPVGRLDAATEGLLLLTNDGELAQRLAHPRHKVDKTYLVKVRGLLSEQARARLASGVTLDDGPTLPADLARVRFTSGNTWFELTLREGRNRQVRRMCEAVGFPVVRLKRLRMGFLELGNLPAGRSRPLSGTEVARLKEL